MAMTNRNDRRETLRLVASERIRAEKREQRDNDIAKLERIKGTVRGLSERKPVYRISDSRGNFAETTNPRSYGIEPQEGVTVYRVDELRVNRRQFR